MRVNELLALETPDQALVWGVALGLRRDIEELLGRTADLLEHGQGSKATFVPAWYSAASPGGTAEGDATAGRAAPLAVARPGAMFAAIQAFGGGARLYRSILPRRESAV